MAPIRPILTFTTDFGLADAYVAEMKAAALVICPEAVLVDVTHLIAPQDVLSGSIVLERAIRSFPAGSVHVAVVDPGVGSDRRLLLAEVDGRIVLAPDNGLITWAYHRARQISTHELLWRPVREASHTFHGRDILTPAAALIAAGRRDAVATTRLDRPVLLDIAPARALDDAVVIHVDHFGNLTTNFPAELLTGDTAVEGIGKLCRTYSEVAIGRPVALIGSSGLLEIAVRNGHAARQLGLAVGSRITLTP